MSKRLTKIYTRTGDEGTTGLADGSRVLKDTPRITAIGEVDELNSVLGLLLAEELPEALRVSMIAVQHDLFDAGGELSIPGHTLVSAAHVARLERELDALNAALPALTDFILPGGSRAAAAAHVARSVCRRAERALVALSHVEAVPPVLIQYFNRLSDLFFVLARALNRHAGGSDVLWEQGKNRKA
ncbi:MAG TPA: cob(I)yrinic acid a,c-diamide adenosyltransferase [Burkholderiales bacterium]|nr:cob(I)yrinic acid a,c-diamide adenosyltransferase [Burkholderiales bacterium]